MVAPAQGLLRIAVALTAASLTIVAPVTPAAAQAPTPTPVAPGRTIPAAQLTSMLAAGLPVELTGATIDGEVDLGPLGTVTRPWRCRDCRFTASLRAKDVVFERLVDLRGSVVEGNLDLGGAVFRDAAGFDQTAVSGAANFDSARFSANVSLARAAVTGPFAFDRARVAGSAFFTQAAMAGHAGFTRSEFSAKADFSQARFGAGTSFEGTVFAERAVFSLTQFAGPARFSGAELRRGGNLRFMRFRDEVTFSQVTAGGAVELDGTLFERDSSFNNLSSSGSVSLIGIRVLRTDLFMERVAVQDFSMDIATVDAVRGVDTRKRLLTLIERSARARDDLAVANNARFALLALQGEDKEGAWPLLVDSAYRNVAGYLVRPVSPLLAFVLVLMVTGLTRAVMRLRAARRSPAPGRRERRPPSVGGPGRQTVDLGRRNLLVAQRVVATWLGGVADSLAVAFRPKPGVQVADEQRVASYFLAGCRLGEFLVYKVLFAVFLLALGNSSATVRDVLDAVRP